MRVFAFVLLAIVGTTSLHAQSGKALLQESSRAHGNRFQSYSNVTVNYDGKWSGFAKMTQPVLVDAKFRGKSTEVYRPRSGNVTQVHTASGGRKDVSYRYSGSTSVSYNGKKTTDREAVDAAALVADAYSMFLFGPSYLLRFGSGFQAAGTGRVSGKSCQIVSGVLRPGIGNSRSDQFRVWIDTKTKVLRRVEFSINGLESTRGAIVDVTMDGFITAKDGSIWPTKFVEHVRKPVNMLAHRWQTTGLVIDGMRVK